MSEAKTIENILIQPARAMFHAAVTVFDPVRTSLRNPLVYTNAGHRDRDFRRRIFWRYAAREEDQPPVIAGWYKDAFINGDGPFFVLAEGGLAAEHIPANTPPEMLAASLAHLLGARGGAVQVDEPCALVCNPGLWVWGHWLLEILPRAVLASRFFGGAVRLAMPRGLIDPELRGFLSEQVLASLSLYGIGQDRLFPIDEGRVYRFRRLADFSGVDGLGHPAVLAALRDIPGLPPAARRRGITAVLRGGGAKRLLTNRDDLAALLDKRGAGVMDPGRATFAAQAMVFRESEIVVGDMGSNLCGALYAPSGAGIVTLAPDRWDDGAMPRLLQDLDVCLADVRGETAGETAEDIMNFPHVVQPADLEAGLDAVRHALRAPPLPWENRVAGRVLARQLGPEVMALHFGNGGDAEPYERRGFAGPEPYGEWSLGQVSSLLLPHIEPVGEGCWLCLKGVGLARPPRLPETVLSIEVNGSVLARFDVAGEARVEVFLPSDVLCRPGPLRLRFHHPRCRSPMELGDPGDTRRLGFFFCRLAIHHAGPSAKE